MIEKILMYKEFLSVIDGLVGVCVLILVLHLIFYSCFNRVPFVGNVGF